MAFFTHAEAIATTIEEASKREDASTFLYWRIEVKDTSGYYYVLHLDKDKAPEGSNNTKLQNVTYETLRNRITKRTGTPLNIEQNEHSSENFSIIGENAEQESGFTG